MNWAMSLPRPIPFSPGEAVYQHVDHVRGPWIPDPLPHSLLCYAMGRGSEELAYIKKVYVIVASILPVRLFEHYLQPFDCRLGSFALLASHIVIDEMAGYFVIQVFTQKCSLGLPVPKAKSDHASFFGFMYFEPDLFSYSVRSIFQFLH